MPPEAPDVGAILVGVEDEHDPPVRRIGLGVAVASSRLSAAPTDSR